MATAGGDVTLDTANFELPSSIEALRLVVRDFADAEIRPRVAEFERAESVPPELVERMGDLGIFAAPFPEADGGSGVGELGFAVVQEELSRAHASTGLLVAAAAGLAARLVHSFGNEEQRARYLDPMLRGQLIGAFCLTEPGGGSDVAALQLRAARTSEGWELSGEKAFVTNGDRAGLFLTFAKTAPERGREGISLFAVERGTPGLSVARLEDKMGLRASGTAQLLYDSVGVGDESLVGGENEGFGVALATLNRSRVGIAAMCLGVAKEALDLGWRYAHGRAMFGHTLADEQVTRHALADMQLDVLAAESVVYRTAARIDAGQPFEAEASIAKVLASEAAQRVVDRSLQLHGGLGYLRGADIERLYRDIRVARIYEGANEVQRNNIYRVMRRTRGH